MATTKATTPAKLDTAPGQIDESFAEDLVKGVHSCEPIIFEQDIDVFISKSIGSIYRFACKYKISRLFF